MLEDAMLDEGAWPVQSRALGSHMEEKHSARKMEANCWVVEPSGSVSSTRKRAASRGLNGGIGNDEVAFAKAKCGASTDAASDDLPPRAGTDSTAVTQYLKGMLK
ncbi:hypothetical protein LJR084_007359 [Variovorax sp. LjRoot84]|uniref:hypothetical protein n=1 Tax=Variovorax sp. LjRoot84 TaxID=3342340 RepID=UPI003ECDF45A